MPSLAYYLSKLARENRGAEIAEAAAVLPLMFLILLGIFWFGQAFSIYGAITRAAEDGARAAAAPYCVTCSSVNSPAANAVTAVNTAMLASRLDPTRIQALSSPPSAIACQGGATSCATVAGSNVCVQAPVQISSTSGGGSSVCGVSVTFQYPFQFWLPFTSLNKQRILLRASARARMENQ
jgi:Flp pilus assembly protein TadG